MGVVLSVCQGGSSEGDGYREGMPNWEGPRNQGKGYGCHPV